MHGLELGIDSLRALGRRRQIEQLRAEVEQLRRELQEQRRRR